MVELITSISFFLPIIIILTFGSKDNKNVRIIS